MVPIPYPPRAPTTEVVGQLYHLTHFESVWCPGKHCRERTSNVPAKVHSNLMELGKLPSTPLISLPAQESTKHVLDHSLVCFRGISISKSVSVTLSVVELRKTNDNAVKSRSQVFFSVGGSIIARGATARREIKRERRRKVGIDFLVHPRDDQSHFPTRRECYNSREDRCAQ